jgi:hypothetical protein
MTEGIKTDYDAKFCSPENKLLGHKRIVLKSALNVFFSLLETLLTQMSQLSSAE